MAGVHELEAFDVDGSLVRWSRYRRLIARVLTEDGGVIEGLHAAGRSAVGVASNGYISGLLVAAPRADMRRVERYAQMRNTRKI